IGSPLLSFLLCSLCTPLQAFLVDWNRWSKSDSKNRAAAARRTAFIGAWGSASTSRKTIRSVEAEWMVFRICITGALLASIIPNWV
ncbi:MAG: hypothetical protein ACLR40_13030, partial [Oscillospiraceae bacterium]